MRVKIKEIMGKIWFVSEREKYLLTLPPGRVTRFDAPGIEFASNIITVEFGEAVMLRSRTHGSGQTLSQCF